MKERRDPKGFRYLLCVDNRRHLPYRIPAEAWLVSELRGNKHLFPNVKQRRAGVWRHVDEWCSDNSQLCFTAAGTMFTDGYIVNGRQNPSPDLNGPTCSGVAYEVVKKVVKPGDIIIIPAGVVHGWLDIPEHVDYLSFRPSPGILTAGWVHPVLKK